MRDADRVADEKPEPQRKDHVLDAPVHEESVARKKACEPRKQEHDGHANDECRERSAEERDTDRCEDEDGHADVERFRQVLPREHGCRHVCCGVSTDLGAERARKRPGSELGQFRGSGCDLLAVSLLERVFDRSAQRCDLLLAACVGLARRRVQLLDPLLAHRCELRVGRPAVTGHHLAEIDHLPGEDAQNDRDHEGTDDYGDPVFRQPAAWHGGCRFGRVRRTGSRRHRLEWCS